MASARLFEEGVQRLLREIEPDDDGLHTQFARVTRTEAKEEHRLPSPSASSSTPSYSHYYGFARGVEGDRSTIWFKMASHLSNSQGMFLGPVTHKPLPSIPPRKNEILFGKVVESSKGKMFEWWVSEATPFKTLCEILRHGTRQTRQSRRLYEQLRLERTLNGTHDDLYLLVRLLVFADTQVMVRQLCAEKAREKHPIEKQKRGYEIEFHPVEFVYFTAKLCMCPAIYDQFLKNLDASKSELIDPVEVEQKKKDFPPTALREYCATE